MIVLYVGRLAKVHETASNANGTEKSPARGLECNVLALGPSGTLAENHARIRVHAECSFITVVKKDDLVSVPALG